MCEIIMSSEMLDLIKTELSTLRNKFNKTCRGHADTKRRSSHQSKTV